MNNQTIHIYLIALYIH